VYKAESCLFRCNYLVLPFLSRPFAKINCAKPETLAEIGLGVTQLVCATIWRLEFQIFWTQILLQLDRMNICLLQVISQALKFLPSRTMILWLTVETLASSQKGQ
jgi:hypothetical protein